MNLYSIISLIILAILICSIGMTLYFDVGTPSPAYEVVSSNKEYEIRRYPAAITASVTIDAIQKNAGNRVFRILADYIYGNNISQQKIAMTKPVLSELKSDVIPMTAPVLEQKDASTYTMTFILPAAYTLENVPKPNDDRIVLAYKPEEKIAVLKFGWYVSVKRVGQKISQLKDVLEKDRVAILGAPVLARYNPPFAFPLLMRNEIWIKVA